MPTAREAVLFPLGYEPMTDGGAATTTTQSDVMVGSGDANTTCSDHEDVVVSRRGRLCSVCGARAI